MPNLQRGGPCLNFAHFSMQFCNPGDPKGEAMAQCPLPKYAPGHGYDLSTIPLKTVETSRKIGEGLFFLETAWKIF